MVKAYRGSAKTSHSYSVGRKVTIESHHSKPFRKRHVGLFILSFIGFVILGALLLQYRDQINAGFASSRNFVSDIFGGDKAYDLNVSSSYGFSLSYDQREFYGSAFDGSSARLIIGSELTVQRPYKIVRIASRSLADGADKTTLTMTVHPRLNPDQKSLEKSVLLDSGVDIANLSRLGTESEVIDGETFTKIKWETTDKASVAGLKARFVTYHGFVQGNFITIVATLGVSSFDSFKKYGDIINSIHFTAPVAKLIKPESSTQSSSVSLIDMLTNTQLVAAATSPATTTASEKISALYSPAVVKIYNAYCMDIRIDGASFVNGVCDAVSGSGFFVSADGYVATNGHVAVAKPLDIAILWSFYAYSKGDSRYLNILVNKSSYKSSNVAPAASSETKLAALLDALYAIEENRITKTNDVSNLLVDVSENIPDVAKLISDTKNRKVYGSDSDVTIARVVDYNYRLLDGIDGWRASDVALLKVDGSNYPTVKLGSITDVTQGSRLSIIGYPGVASENGLVDWSKAVATLTTGSVSSIKSVAGSDNKLIETDTTIGHGNSGGPAFNDDGKVVGLATYSVDASGQGYGTYNYIRDIQDFKDLIKKHDISIESGDTQDKWEKGIEAFYGSHYSKAVGYFIEVQKLYPNHSKVSEFIAAANTRIKNGEDVVDFPIVPLIIGLIILFIVFVISLILIILHKRKHNVYKEGLNQGVVNTDLLVQTVNVASQKPVITAVDKDPIKDTSTTLITAKIETDLLKDDEESINNEANLGLVETKGETTDTIADTKQPEEATEQPQPNIDDSSESIETEPQASQQVELTTRTKSLIVPPERSIEKTRPR